MAACVKAYNGNTLKDPCNSSDVLFRGPEYFRLLDKLKNRGKVETILTHSQLDSFATCNFENLSEETQSLFQRYFVRSRTIGGKPVDGETARRDGNFYSFVSKDVGYFPKEDVSFSVEIIVPAEVLDRFPETDRASRGCFWDVTSSNTKFTFHSDNSVSALLLTQENAVAPKILRDGQSVWASESMLWIPCTKEYRTDAEKGREYRRCRFENCEAAGALSRIAMTTFVGTNVFLVQPSSLSGVFVIEPGDAPKN